MLAEGNLQETNTETHSHQSSESRYDSRLRMVTSTVLVAGVAVLSACFFLFLLYHLSHRTSVEGSWFLQIIDQHFVAAIGIPLSARLSDMRCPDIEGNSRAYRV